ncbi:hypothetical protein STENM223S_04250 [Streptomyces tendae]
MAIGFGARNLVTDFLSGVFMILEDQYGVGDTVDAGVATGEVIEVGLRVTKLRGADGEIWYVRNGEVKRIGNLSQGWATANVDVTVRSDEDLDRVKTVLSEVAERTSKEEPWNETPVEPVEVLGLDSVLLDSMVVRVSAKTMPGKSLTVERELRWRIKRAFDAHGIRIVGGATATEDAPARRSCGGGGRAVRVREFCVAAVDGRVAPAGGKHGQVTPCRVVLAVAPPSSRSSPRPLEVPRPRRPLCGLPNRRFSPRR